MDYILSKYYIITSEAQCVKATGNIKPKIIINRIEITIDWFTVSFG